jgi:hypothetical protein
MDKSMGKQRECFVLPLPQWAIAHINFLGEYLPSCHDRVGVDGNEQVFTITMNADAILVITHFTGDEFNRNRFGHTRRN